MQVTIADTKLDEISAIYELRYDPQVLREQYAPGMLDTPDRFAKLLELGKSGLGNLFRCTSIYADGSFVGHVIQTFVPTADGTECRCGWNLAPSHWGCGIMPRALRMLFEVRFRSGHARAIVASCFSSNVRCQRVLAKLGFQRERVGWNDWFQHVLISGSLRGLQQFRLLAETFANGNHPAGTENYGT